MPKITVHGGPSNQFDEAAAPPSSAPPVSETDQLVTDSDQDGSLMFASGEELLEHLDAVAGAAEGSGGAPDPE